MIFDIASFVGTNSPEQAVAAACLFLILMYVLGNIDLNDRILNLILFSMWLSCAVLAALFLGSVTSMTNHELSPNVLTLMLLALFVVLYNVYSVKPKEIRMLKDRIKKLESHEFEKNQKELKELYQRLNSQPGSVKYELKEGKP